MNIIYKDHNGLIVREISEPPNEPKGQFYTIQTDELLTGIGFQDGLVPDNGLNGVTNESLIAVVIHRLWILNGLYPCIENQIALDNLKIALDSLELRTTRRIARGVEGKLVK